MTASSSLPVECDVVVIGGGPGGSTASALLAARGYDVVLLERERHPRPHVGESLIPHFWPYVDELGATARVLQEGFIRKSGGTVIWNDDIRQLSFGDFGFDRPALHVEREVFDAILFETARERGVQAFERVSATKIELSEPRQLVRWRDLESGGEGELRCRYVVDASGQNSLLSRQLNLRVVDEAFRFLAMWGYYEDSRYIGDGGGVYPASKVQEEAPTTTVESVGADQGWLWHIPMRVSTSVGLLLPPQELKRRGAAGAASVERFYHETVASTAYASKLVESARFVPGSFGMTRDYSYSSRQYAGPGYFLVGDAAAFVDPLFSVGVVFALYSGFAAAAMLDRCLKKPARASQRERFYNEQMRARVALARALALPSYSDAVEIDPSVRAFFELESSNERAMIATVASLTNRSRNLDELSPGKYYESRAHTLAGIDFDRPG